MVITKYAFARLAHQAAKPMGGHTALQMDGDHRNLRLVRFLFERYVLRYIRINQLPNVWREGGTVAVVTVTGEYGTGSEQVVSELARKTGYDHIGEELLKEIADQLHLTESEVEVFRKASHSRLIRLMDRYTCSLVQKVVDRTHGCLDDRDFHDTATALVEKLYTAGNVVIHDWGAQCILKGRPETVHVFLQQDRDAKIEAAMQQLHIDFQAARSIVDDEERNSEQYIRQFFKADWKDPRLYDLIIDRSKTSVAAAAQMIADHLQRRTPTP